MRTIALFLMKRIVKSAENKRANLINERNWIVAQAYGDMVKTYNNAILFLESELKIK